MWQILYDSLKWLFIFFYINIFSHSFCKGRFQLSRSWGNFPNSRRLLTYRFSFSATLTYARDAAHIALNWKYQIARTPVCSWLNILTLCILGRGPCLPVIWSSGACVFLVLLFTHGISESVYNFFCFVPVCRPTTWVLPKLQGGWLIRKRWP